MPAGYGQAYYGEQPYAGKQSAGGNTFSLSGADSAVETDVATRLLVLARNGTDTALAADAPARLLVLARSGADSALAADVSSRLVVLVRAGSDSAVAADTATRVVLRVPVGSDQALAADVALAARVFIRTGADLAAAFDVAFFGFLTIPGILIITDRLVDTGIPADEMANPVFLVDRMVVSSTRAVTDEPPDPDPVSDRPLTAVTITDKLVTP